MKVFQQLAQSVQARINCDQGRGTNEWFIKHEERIEEIVKEHLPSGSGFDNGTTIDLDRSNGTRLVFNTAFHHMHSDSGMYDGWTEHRVTVIPSFDGFTLAVSGKNRNDIRDYIADSFHHALHAECKE